MNNIVNTLKRIRAVSKVVNKSSNTSMFSSKKKKGKRATNTSSKIVAYVFATIGIAFAVAFYTFMIYFKLSVALAGKFINEELAIIYLVTFLITFLFSFINVFSVFFLSNDNEAFLPLPIKSSELFLGRVVASLKNTLLINLGLMVPYMLSYLILVPTQVVAYFLFPFIFLSTTLIQIAIVFAIGTLVSKFINLAKHRDAVSVIMTILPMMLMIGIEFYFIYGMGSMETIEVTEDIIKLLRSQTLAIYNIISPLKFLFYLPVTGIQFNSWYGFGIGISFFFVALLIGGLALILAKFTYNKVILGSGDGKGRKAKVDEKKLDTLVNNGVKNSSGRFGKYKMLLSVEWKKIARAPMAAFQLIFPVIFVPVILLVVGITSFIQGFGQGVEGLNIASYTSPIDLSYFYSIGLLVVYFTCSVSSQFSSTAISREGTDILILKTIPIDGRDVVRAKVTLGITINVILSTVMSIVLGIVLKANVWAVVCLIISTIPLCIFSNYKDLLIDAKYGKINWQNQIEAFKNNVSTIVAIGTDFLVLIFMLPILLPFVFFPSTFFIPFAIFIGIFGGGTILMINFVENNFLKYIGKLNVV